MFRRARKNRSCTNICFLFYSGRCTSAATRPNPQTAGLFPATGCIVNIAKTVHAWQESCSVGSIRHGNGTLQCMLQDRAAAATGTCPDTPGLAIRPSSLQPPTRDSSCECRAQMPAVNCNPAQRPSSLLSKRKCYQWQVVALRSDRLQAVGEQPQPGPANRAGRRILKDRDVAQFSAAGTVQQQPSRSPCCGRGLAPGVSAPCCRHSLSISASVGPCAGHHSHACSCKSITCNAAFEFGSTCFWTGLSLPGMENVCLISLN